MIQVWFPKRPDKHKSIFIEDGEAPAGYVRVRRVGNATNEGLKTGKGKIVRATSLMMNYEKIGALTLSEMMSRYRLDASEVRRTYGDRCFSTLTGSGLPSELYRIPDSARPVASVKSIAKPPVMPSLSDVSIADLIAEVRRTNALLTTLVSIWGTEDKAEVVDGTTI